MTAGEWTEIEGKGDGTGQSEAELCVALQAAVDTIEGSPLEVARRQSLLIDMELFLGVRLSNLYQLSGVDMTNWSMFQATQQIAYNVCYSIPTTIHNRICSFRPRAQFLPDGGDFKAKRAARDMTDLSDGWAQRVDYQFEASFAMRDLLTGDGGVLKMFISNEDEKAKTADIEIARFPSWEFLFDEADGVYRLPHCGYHVHYLPVEQASRTYGVDEKVLRSYAVSQPRGIVYIANRDMVRVIDAYSRGPGGRHVLCLANRAIINDAWEYDGHPFIRRTFDQRPIGVWGDGAVKRLRPIQYELIEWQNSVRNAHYLTSQQVHQVQDGEDGPQKITNETVRIERYKDKPSQIINPPAVNQEMYTYYNTLEQAAYKLLGVSQFIAAGTKQPGINSAVAIRESSELQTDRLALLSQNWETMRIESAEWWRRFASDLTKRGYKLKYRAIRRGTFLEMSVENSEREYEIRAFPSSLFGQTISGRLERATELIKAGFLSRTDAMKALDIPDLSPIVDLELSEAYAMEFYVDNILEEGKYETPDEQIDPTNFYDYASKRYKLTISDGSNYPEDNRALLRKLLAYLKPKADAARAKAAVVPGAPQPTGGASPEQIQAEGTAAASATPAAGAGQIAA